MLDRTNLNHQKVVALVGSPNSGKTTLFNWLTNSKFKTVNYPGATVEYSLADLASQWGRSNEKILVMDTPGTYSLLPKSDDELVTQRALYEHPEFGPLQHVIAVVDATQLARHLVLVHQLLEAGFKVTVALTMSDLLKDSGQAVDIVSLSQKLGCPVIPIFGLLGGGIRELVASLSWIEGAQEASSLRPPREDRQHQLALLKKSDELAQSVFVVERGQKNKLFLQSTEKWDRVLMHPFWGLIVFVATMSLLFTAIFTIAAPFMDGVDASFSWAAEQVAQWGGDTLWADFLGHGVMASFGAVFVFVPQIFILFLLIGFLESTGYLARAATLVDRPLSFFGMSGRSFVPLLSGFACAVPALMATRNISSKRDRFITMMIIPLMTCSARLPVYALLLAFLFKGKPAWQAGLGLTVLYFGAIVVGAVVSQILHRLIKKDQSSFFMMELPLYRRPRLGVVLSQAWTKTFGYIRRAGPPIFIFALLIWTGTTFPNYNADTDQVKLETSYAGQLGQWIEPVFKPMGADWRVGVSLISAFAAREVFASSLAVIFNVTAEDDAGLETGLLESMAQAHWPDGRPLFTIGSVLALLVFVMIALQCTSTTAMVIRETGRFSGALWQLLAFNLLAYLAAVGIFQLWS